MAVAEHARGSGLLLGWMILVPMTLAVVLWQAQPARAGTITVTNALDDNSAGTLRQSVEAAGTGDTILFAPGFFSVARTITLQGQIIITKSLVIDGSTAAISPTISGGNVTRTLTIKAGAVVMLDHLRIIDGAAPVGNGGGIYNAGNLDVRNSAFVSNSAISALNSDYGGAIYNSGIVTVSHSLFISNTADLGGGLRNDGIATVIDCRFSGNVATSDGGGISSGGIFALNASTVLVNTAWAAPDVVSIPVVVTLNVSHSIFVNNHAAYGAAIWSGSPASIMESYLSHNAAIVSAGGIFNNFAPITLASSTLYSNSAAYGGAILNASGVVTIANATIVTNSASIEGGAVFNEGVMTVTNATLAGNNSALGSTFSSTGTASIVVLVLRNTIVAYGAGQDGCYANVVDGGYNLETGTVCGLTTPHSLQHANPGLGLLQVNSPGLDLPTMALAANSPAINAGSNAFCPPTDERGIPRSLGGVCDMGAFEYWLAAHSAYMPILLRY